MTKKQREHDSMKDYKDDKFNEILGDKLRSIGEVPPAGMFDRIEQTLLANGVVRSATDAQSAPKVVPLWSRLWVRGVAAAAVAAVFALVVVVALRDNAPAEIEVVAEMVEQMSDEQPEEMASVEPVTTEKRVLMAANIAKPQQPIARVQVNESESVEVEPEVRDVETRVEQNNKPSNMQKTTARERKRRERTRTSRHSQQDLEQYWRSVMAEDERKGGVARPVEMELYAANMGFNNGHIARNGLVNNQMMVQEQSGNYEGGSYISPSLVNREENYNLEHFMPITVGVTLSYSLNDWLSVDSGLLYTNVYSKSNSSGAMSLYERRRTMDYLGVPLSLSVYFAGFDRLLFYGRFGGTAELCINANDKTFIDGEFAEKYALDVPRLTFSLDASLGATYALWDNVGVFGELGCTYWNVPNGYVENYRTVHPLSLSSRFGLRFTFN